MILPNIPKCVAFILRRLEEDGHQAYIIGGAMRDACLNRPVTDWDVATSARPDAIKLIFKDKKLFMLRRETVTIVDVGHHVEVTPFRGVENTLLGDLSRRDFTINAMAFDLDKSEVIDPHGGRRDIRNRLIRAVGNPMERFREDPLRLMRAVRLATELGFRFEDQTIRDIGCMASLLSSVSTERIREELIKILICPRPSVAFKTMIRTGLLAHFLPELLEGYLKRQNHYHRYTIFRHVMKTVDKVEPEPAMRLTALLHDIAKPRVRIKAGGEWRFHGHEESSALLAKKILDRLKFSNDLSEKVTNLIRHHMIGYDSSWSDGAIRRLIRRVRVSQVMDLLAFRRADISAHGVGDQRIRLLCELEKRVRDQIESEAAISIKDLAVDGHAVMAITGLSPGPEVGKILKDLNERVLDRPELNCERELTALLEEMKARD